MKESEQLANFKRMFFNVVWLRWGMEGVRYAEHLWRTPSGDAVAKLNALKRKFGPGLPIESDP